MILIAVVIVLVFLIYSIAKKTCVPDFLHGASLHLHVCVCVRVIG